MVGERERGPRIGRAATYERDALERRWITRLIPHLDLGPLVTGESLADEPFHRWLPYRQGFAPELVRRFLAEHSPLDAPARAPLLDPFAGVGTFVIECARRGVAACGVEALPWLAWAARERSARGLPRFPDLTGCTTWQQAAARLDLPIHRLALLCALVRCHTAEGDPNPAAPPLPRVLRDVLEMMRADLEHPLNAPIDVACGDARRLSHLPDASIGGMLTSPPYFSRHDYRRITRPHESAYREWYARGADGGACKPVDAGAWDDVDRRLIRATARAVPAEWSESLPPVVAEIRDGLRAARQARLGGILRSYFDGLFGALREAARVLAPGAPAWWVIGNARIKGEPIPTDLILADFAETVGFEVAELRVARSLAPAERRDVRGRSAPTRETILVLRRGKA